MKVGHNGLAGYNGPNCLLLLFMMYPVIAHVLVGHMVGCIVQTIYTKSTEKFKCLINLEALIGSALTSNVKSEAADGRTALQQVYMLELMLGQIANYCPVISRNTIVKNSTSLSCIWQTIRLHYGFQTTGAHFLDFADIQLQAERPEDLYQRLVAFVEDNMLQRGSVILHHGDAINVDEEMTPSLENMVVLTWLRLINVVLPKLVKQRYGTELRARTLASIKPDISQALDSLLDEITSADDAKIMRTATAHYQQNTFGQRQSFSRRQPSPCSAPRRSTSTKACPLCKQAGRSNVQHFLSECPYLPEQDRRYMAKIREVTDVHEEDDEYEYSHELLQPVDQPTLGLATAQRIDIRQSPYHVLWPSHGPSHH